MCSDMGNTIGLPDYRRKASTQFSAIRAYGMIDALSLCCAALPSPAKFRIWITVRVFRVAGLALGTSFNEGRR